MNKINYNNNLHIIIANLEDINSIIELLEKRCIWMENNNIDQWKCNSYTLTFNQNYFKEQINQKRVYVAKINNTVCGVFLLKYEDPKFWNTYDNAIYIHHLATDINYKGLGKLMINKIKEIALKKGISYIRIDCVSKNKKLNDYYNSLGFILKGSGVINNYNYNLRELKLL